MLETIKKQWQARVAFIIFVFFTFWWFLIQFSIYFRDELNKFFGVFYGLMALWGALLGIHISTKWGGSKSLIGKSLLFFAFGLFAQEFGQLSYFYYVFIKKIEIPYPSIGDLGYFGSIPLYIYGTILLAQASGVNVSLKNFRSKVQVIVIPLVLLILSYNLFLKGYEFDWSNPIKIFLDFGYPFGQAIYISLALLTYFLSRSILGGMMKNKVLFILFALCLQYAADFTFLYQASKGTFQAGGVVDYMYLVAYFVMTLGLLQFNTALAQLRQGK